METTQELLDEVQEIQDVMEELHGAVEDDDPNGAIELCDKIATRLSNLRSELAETTVHDVSEE
jgi:HPt (histidine-containing phosphotransfer) domain-containing protein